MHALLGENGAGKSTLMNILDGLYRPDEGEILIDGEPVAFGSPRDAIAAGLGMVHQHFALVESMTVTENVLIGLDRPRFRLDLKRKEAEVAALAEANGLRVHPNAKVWQLSVGERQRVEILKVLYRGARILIMDEPTAVLAPQEVDDLFRTLRSMTAAGRRSCSSATSWARCCRSPTGSPSCGADGSRPRASRRRASPSRSSPS